MSSTSSRPASSSDSSSLYLEACLFAALSLCTWLCPVHALLAPLLANRRALTGAEGLAGRAPSLERRERSWRGRAMLTDCGASRGDSPSRTPTHVLAVKRSATLRQRSHLHWHLLPTLTCLLKPQTPLETRGGTSANMTQQTKQKTARCCQLADRRCVS